MTCRIHQGTQLRASARNQLHAYPDITVADVHLHDLRRPCAAAQHTRPLAPARVGRAIPRAQRRRPGVSCQAQCVQHVCGAGWWQRGRWWVGASARNGRAAELHTVASCGIPRCRKRAADSRVVGEGEPCDGCQLCAPAGGHAEVQRVVAERHRLQATQLGPAGRPTCMIFRPARFSA